MSRPKYRRSNFFINKEYQGRAIFQYFLLILAGSVLFSIIFSVFSSNTISIVYDNYHLRIGTTPGILMDKLFSTQWFFIVICGMAVIVITLFMTHRVAGPFYRFERTIDAMNGGDISGHVHLRKNDEGKGVAERLNAFNNGLAKRLTEMEVLNNEIRLLVAEDQVAEDRAAEAETLLRIREKSDAISEMINQFTFTRR